MEPIVNSYGKRLGRDPVRKETAGTLKKNRVAGLGKNRAQY